MTLQSQFYRKNDIITHTRSNAGRILGPLARRGRHSQRISYTKAAPYGTEDSYLLSERIPDTLVLVYTHVILVLYPVLYRDEGCTSAENRVEDRDYMGVYWYQLFLNFHFSV